MPVATRGAMRAIERGREVYAHARARSAGRPSVRVQVPLPPPNRRKADDWKTLTAPLMAVDTEGLLAALRSPTTEDLLAVLRRG